MHHNDDYVSLAHGNMNVDNAYFWRNEEGSLELGVFDWGGMGCRCLGCVAEISPESGCF